MINRPKPIYLF
jgi:hypothetical protein